jgi:hypothetical protein
MKVNDIFERDFEGQNMRFQLIELKPYLVTVQTVDIDPPLRRSGKLLLAALPKVALATSVDGEYVATRMGESWAKRFATFIYNRLTARNKSINWLIEIKDMEPEEAKVFVDKIECKLNDWEVRYLQAIVKWAYYGEINPDNEGDINRVKELLLLYFTYLKEHKTDDVEKLRFANICFRITRNGERDRYLWSMKEVGWYLRSWEKKRVQHI